MNFRIQQELERVVGGGAVSVTDVATQTPANPRVRLETAQSVYELPANRTLIFLEKLPDRIGVEAFREAIERRFPSATQESDADRIP